MSEGWFRSLIGEICVFLFPAVNSSDWWTSLVFNRQTANSGFTDEISNREHDCSWSVFLDNYFSSMTFLTFWDLSNKRKSLKGRNTCTTQDTCDQTFQKYLLRKSRENSWSVVISNNSLREKWWDKVDKRPIILLSAGNTCVSILRSRSSKRERRKELGHLPIFPELDAPLASWSSLFSFLCNPIGANVPLGFSRLAWLGGIQNWKKGVHMISYDFKSSLFKRNR